jgi:hypothetical protein
VIKNPTRLIACALLLLPAGASAQVRKEELIHWAYAAYFGTGRYELGDAESVYAIRANPGREWREPSLDGAGKRTPGFRLRVPVAVSTHDFHPDDLIENIQIDNVSTLSIVPGVEFEIPMNARWTLKPFVHLGAGKELGGHSSAWIHWLGVKSQLGFQSGKTRWAMINSLTRVGYSSDSAPSGQLLPWLTAFEFSRRLDRTAGSDDPVHLHWHVSYTSYLDELGIASGGVQFADIDQEWELGLGFGRGERKLKLWRLSLDRFGIAYRLDSSGDFSGVRLVFKSLFDQ